MYLILRYINCANKISRSRSNSSTSNSRNKKRLSSDVSEHRNHNANKSKPTKTLSSNNYKISKFTNNTSDVVVNISNVEKGGGDEDENEEETLTSSNYLFRFHIILGGFYFL